MSAEQAVVAQSPQAPRAIIRKRLLFAAAAIVLVLAALLAYLTPRPRSFAIEAQTRAVALSFAGGEAMNSWLLPDALVCVRHARRTAGEVPVSADDAKTCDPRLYDIAHPVNGQTTWRDGDVVSLARPGSGALEILVQKVGAQPPDVDGTALTESSRIVVPDGPSLDGLILNFAGHITIGDVPGPGSRHTLISGTYEVREAMPTQERPVPLLTGDLFPGDRIRILADGTENDVTSYGFVAVQSGADALEVVAYSPAGDSVLRADRFGAKPILTTPTWIDRVVHDPILVAITTIAGIVGAILVFIDVYTRVAGRIALLPSGPVAVEPKAGAAAPSSGVAQPAASPAARTVGGSVAET